MGLSSVAADPSSSRSALGGWLLIALIVVAVAGKPVLYDTLDPDLFWHLRVADRLAEGGIHPIVDDLSFASLRTPWTPYSWLAELAMRAVWQAGGYRLAVAAAVMCFAGFFALLAWACMQMGFPPSPLYAGQRVGVRGNGAISASPQTGIPPGTAPHPALSPAYRGEGVESEPLQRPSAIAIALALVFAAVLALFYLSFRPVTMALVLLALIAGLLLRDRRLGERWAGLWWIVPLTALLVNIHLFAWMSPLWVLALLAGSIWEWWMFDAIGGSPLSLGTGRGGSRAELLRRVRRYALLLNLTLVACLLTPMLPGMVGTALHYQSDDPVLAARVIGETQPIWYGPAAKVCTTLAVLAAAALCIACNGRWLRMGEKIWLAGSTLLLLKMGRFSPLFVLIAAPVVAGTLPRFSGRILACPAVIGLLAGLLAMGGWKIYSHFPPPAMSLDAWLNRNGPETGYPTGAAAFVQGNIRPRSGHLINEFSWGGYLAWRLRGQFEILIDGRTQVYSPQMWRSLYLDKDARQRQAYLASLQADAAVLPAHKSLFHDALINCGWTSVYRDDQAEVLKPPPN